MLYLYTEWFTEKSEILTFDNQIFRFAKQANKILVDLDDESVENVSQAVSLCDVNSLASEMTPDQAKAIGMEESDEHVLLGDLIRFVENSDQSIPRIAEQER